MNRCGLVVALGMLLCGLAMAQTSQPAGPTTRKSADGMGFPEAGERKLSVSLPWVGEKLGCLPEEFADKVLSTTRSRSEMQRRARQRLDTDWFTYGVGPADAVGIGLTDGRVSRVVMVFALATPERLKQLREQMGNMAPPNWPEPGEATVSVTNTTNQQPILIKVSLARETLGRAKPIERGWARLTFEVDPMELYILTHEVKPEVAQGLREKKVVVGMTYEQAILVMGKPEVTQQLNGGGTAYAWPRYKDELQKVELMGGSVDTYKRTIDKVLIVVVADGYVVGVREDDFQKGKRLDK